MALDPSGLHRDGESTLDEMARLVIELRDVGEVIAVDVGALAKLREDTDSLVLTIGEAGDHRKAIQARLLVLAQWINT